MASSIIGTRACKYSDAVLVFKINTPVFLISFLDKHLKKQNISLYSTKNNMNSRSVHKQPRLYKNESLI